MTRPWRLLIVGGVLTAIAAIVGKRAAAPPPAAGTSRSVPAPGATTKAKTTHRPPNIVLIIADDLGYHDLACYGSKSIKTPHIDALARGGMTFTDAYVTAPVCSPSRAGLLTGRYQQRFGYEFNTGPARPETLETIGLPLTERTLADALSTAGYATGLVGKWHLGAAPKFHPLNRGFREFFGFLGPETREGHHTILRGRTVVDENEYLSDAFTRESLAFIERHRREPFFLMVSYSAPHLPMDAPAKYQDRYPSLSPGNVRTYAAMVSSVDDGVGEILRKLASARLSKDT